MPATTERMTLSHAIERVTKVEPGATTAPAGVT